MTDEKNVGNDLCVVPSDFLPNQIIEKWFAETENKYGIRIDKYIIMPDHIHFILVINTERHTGRSLPDIMQWFKTMTTNEYIRHVKNNLLKPFHKKLWQKSYFEHIIRNQDDYIETWKYIIENPQRWVENIIKEKGEI